MTHEEWEKYYPPAEHEDNMAGLWVATAVLVIAFVLLITRFDFTQFFVVTLPTWGIR